MAKHETIRVVTDHVHPARLGPYRVGRTAPTLLQVFNVDGVEAVSVNGTELEVSAAVLFEQFGVNR